MEDLITACLLELANEHMQENADMPNGTKVNRLLTAGPAWTWTVNRLAAKLLAKGVQLPEQSGYTNDVEPYDTPGDID